MATMSQHTFAYWHRTATTSLLLIGICFTDRLHSDEGGAAAEAEARSQTSGGLILRTGSHSAKDSLQLEAANAAEAEALAGFAWSPQEFSVELAPMPEIVNGRRSLPGCWAVSFPSPKPIGDEQIDRVVCELYVARDRETREVLYRPALIVVHESGSAMPVGRMIATETARRGLHALMVQLPGYGSRRSANADRRQQDNMVEVFTQGVCDVRRARDAAAALPFVDDRHIALQGTSLGGFVATLTGSLDGRFDQVYLLLCGGNLHRVLTEGGQDAAKALERLQASGIDPEALEEVLWPVEPLRLAHRLEPSKTWLFSARFDTVVPPVLSRQLAEAIGLQPQHHRELLATHYSGIIFLPGVLRQVCENAGL
jgi:hypothetical protein